MERDKMIKEMACKIERIFIEESRKEENKMYPWQDLPVFHSVCLRIATDIIPEGSVVLTKEEYDDLQSEYDKVYKQAEADIHGNIADGGTSCHWCEDITKRETAKEILLTLKGLIKEPWQSYELAIDDLQRIAQNYGVEVE